MKENYMAEKTFREIDKRIQQEFASDPVARKKYLEKKRKQEQMDEINKQVRKEMHLYG